MASKTKIEWTSRIKADGTVTPGATWTPIRARVRNDAAVIAREKGYWGLVQIAERMAGRVGPHCERISPACATPCYSEAANGRCLPRNGTGLPFNRQARDLVDIFVDEKILRQPLSWRRPRTIFVCSQTDLFGEWVPFEAIRLVWLAMVSAPKHRFLLLTKRPARALEWTRTHQAAWFSNIWLGVTAENQACADERIPLLLQVPAGKRFVSCEPLLEGLDLKRWLYPSVRFEDGRSVVVPPLDWVIAGGGTGVGAMPSRAAWFRRLRDDAVVAGVPFHFKQWGEYSWVGRGFGGSCDVEPKAVRVGKARAGRLLDGCEWNEVPE